jgi:flagellar motor switch protein FliG
VSTAVARADAAPRALTGPQKVAVLYMALGAEAAAKITQRLQPDEMETIIYEIARTEQVRPDLVEQVLTEWVEMMLGAGSLAAGGLQYAREVLEQALGPQRAAQVLRRIQEQLTDHAGLHRLRKADPAQLGNMLRTEHPQTIALVLAHLDAPHTAAVLKELDTQLGAEVLYRMARMEKVSPEMLQLIERSIVSDTDLNMSQAEASGGPQAVAAVLNLINASMEKELLDGVSARDAALSEQIKNLMFTFEDLVRLDDRAMQRVLREVDTKELALALKAASEELRGKVTKAMSQRAVAALSEEMEMLGPVRMRDVEDAQGRIIARVRQLEESGEVVLNGGGDELVVG